MKTKLVYVLTCTENKYYIEQALMSVFSARHWNPDAHIVLLVDDQTDLLLVGKRSEILNYVSEKIVVPFDDFTLSPVYRSRWIKTSVRPLVQGDLMYIDCDTIVQKPLSEIDDFTCDVGAVPDSHLPVKDYNPSMYDRAKQLTASLGVDLDAEKLYYNGGIIYSKDSDASVQFYKYWHQYWLDSVALSIGIDQPALAKANREMGRIVNPIPDVFNCIVYTQNSFTRDARILHISAFRNPSYLFTDKVLAHVRANGLENKWLIDSILNPCATMLPFDNDVLHSTCKQRRTWIKEIAQYTRGYGKYIDESFSGFLQNSRFQNVVVALLRIRWNRLAAWLWMVMRRCNVLIHKSDVKNNVCGK